MAKVYFVLHAQPKSSKMAEKMCPLSREGIRSSGKVLNFFKGLPIDYIYSSPYKRSVQTISSTAKHFNKNIIIDERFRDRQKGVGGNKRELIFKRWANKDFSEPHGESINMVQKRSIWALHDILDVNSDCTIIIATHCTLLSCILNYYDSSFDCDDFLRIYDCMPYIIEVEFDGESYIFRTEHSFLNDKDAVISITGE